MMRVSVSLLPILLAAAPTAGLAQDGPSFNCRYASTRTEIAICASPELAALERRMVGAYEELVDAIGQREARAIADELLVRRQACEGDPDCIVERLLISEEVFRQRAGGATELVQAEPEPPAPIVEEAPQVATRSIQIEPEAPVVVEPDSDLPLAAQAPLPPEAAPIPPVRPDAGASIELASSEDLSEALDSAELASSDNAMAAEPDDALPADPEAQAAFDTPLSWAWMELPREQRAAIQARLAVAGFYEGPESGAWTEGTRMALESALSEPGSQGFDLTTQQGAALALDYLDSDAFMPVEDTAAAVDPVDLPEW